MHGESQVRGAGDLATLQNLIKPFIGVGILALPNAFKGGGLLASTLMMILLSNVALWCIFRLGDCVDVILEDRKAQAGRVKRTKQFKQSEMNNGEDSGIDGYQRSSFHVDSRRTDDRLEKKTDEEKLTVDAKEVHASNVDEDELDVEEKILSRKLEESACDEEVEEETFVDFTRHRSGSLVAGDSAEPTAVSITKLPSFSECGYYAFGKWGKWVTDLCLVISQIGACIAYVIFISDHMDEVFPSTTRIEWVLLVMIPLAVLTQIRRVESLAFTSSAGNIVYLFTLIVIFYQGFSSFCCVPTTDIVWFRAEGLPFVFGTSAFALEGIALVLPVKYSMKDGENFSFLMKIAMLVVSAMYLSFAIFGYLFFGDNTKVLVTMNLIQDSGLTKACLVSLSITLFFTFVIQVFPVSQINDALIDKLFYTTTAADLFKSNNLANSLRVANRKRMDTSSSPITVSDVNYHAFGAGMDDDESTSRISPSSSSSSSSSSPAAAGAADRDRDQGLDSTRKDENSSPRGAGEKASALSSSSTPMADVPLVAEADSGSDSGSSPLRGGPSFPSFPTLSASPSISTEPSTCPCCPNLRWSWLPYFVCWYDRQKKVCKGRKALQTYTRIAVVVFVCFVAMVFPSFKLIINLFGSFSNAALAYILPCLFYVKICAPQKKSAFIVGGDAASDSPADEIAPSSPQQDMGIEDGDGGEDGFPADAKGVAWYNRYMAHCCGETFSFFFLPCLVIVLGSLASFVGISFSINEIINPVPE